MPPLLPNAATIAIALLREALPGEVTISPTRDENLLERLPFVTVEKTGGTVPHPRLLGLSTVVVQCWARGWVSTADELAGSVQAALWQAVEQQTVTDHGHLSWVTVTADTSALNLAGQPADVHACQTSYRMAVRAPHK